MQKDGRLLAALAIVYVVWGSTYLGIKWTIETTPALLSAGVRFVAAGAVLALVLRARRGRSAWRVERHRVGWAALRGVLLLAGGNGMVVLAETRVPSGLAALLVASVPLFLVGLRLAIGERTAGRTVVGVLLGLVGVAVLLAPGIRGDVDLAYSALVLLAALSWAGGSLISTHRPVPRDPLLLAAIEMLSGGVVLIGLASVRGEWSGIDLAAATTRSWLSLVYLIVFGSIVAFSAYVWLLGNAPPSLATTYAYVNPAVAVLLGVALADERLTAAVVIGGGIILVSVAIVVVSESRSRTPVAAEPATVSVE